MVKRAKNHHIVPKVLQKGFTIQGDQKTIWRAKRTKNETFQALNSKPITKTFVIKDYYTVIENDQLSDSIEREIYGPLDNFLGEILPKAIQAVTNGEIPQFSSNEQVSVKDAVLKMATRTPDFLNKHDDITIGREVVEATLKSLPDEAPLSERDKLEKQLKDDDQLLAIGRNIRVKATIHNSPRVTDALSSFVLRWAVSETKHSFILASRMVYRIGNGEQNGLRNSNAQWWMPITPKIALVLVLDPENKIPHKVVVTPDHIRTVNEYAVSNSLEVASHSQALLKSLLRL